MVQSSQPVSETHYEIVFRDGACVSVPVTEEKNTVRFTESGHVNFFQHLEEGGAPEGVANKEHELEKKKEQEDYEKQIGLLTYLGQGSKESTGETPWYEKPSLLKSLPQEQDRKQEQSKLSLDPLRAIQRYLGKDQIKRSDLSKAVVNVTTGNLNFPSQPITAVACVKQTDKTKLKRKEKKVKKHKYKRKKTATDSDGSGSPMPSRTKRKRRESDSSDADHQSSKKRRRAESRDTVTNHKPKKKKKKEKNFREEDDDSSSDSDTEKKRKLEALRIKRLQREKEERARTNKLLASIRGEADVEVAEVRDTTAPVIEQKYHSQYCPDLAKQNRPLDPSTKYWLQ